LPFIVQAKLTVTASPDCRISIFWHSSGSSGPAIPNVTLSTAALMQYWTIVS
jgi:hypothetical protein